MKGMLLLMHKVIVVNEDNCFSIVDVLKEVIDQQSTLYNNVTIEGNVMKFNSQVELTY